jgi:hypothetical protein
MTAAVYQIYVAFKKSLWRPSHFFRFSLLYCAIKDRELCY